MCEVTVRDGHHFLTLGVTADGHVDARSGSLLSVRAEVRAGGFRGVVGGQVWASQLAAFHRRLADTLTSRNGFAELLADDEWLSIRVTARGEGRLTWWCAVQDDQAGANLVFCLSVDPGEARAAADSLAAAVRSFTPVSSRP